jgi:hypothetical protein
VKVEPPYVPKIRSASDVPFFDTGTLCLPARILPVCGARAGVSMRERLCVQSWSVRVLVSMRGCMGLCDYEC